MIRRKLFAYAVMMTAGITSGYFIMEKTELLQGALFMTAVALAVIIMLKYGCSSDVTATEDAVTAESVLLICIMFAGFLMFTVRFISYESELANVMNYSAGDSSDSDELWTELTGRVEYVRIKEDGYRITLTDASISSDDAPDVLKYKVLVSYYSELDEPYELIGRKVTVSGKMQEPTPADNPGCFDYKLYLRSIGTGSRMKAENIADIGADAGSSGNLKEKAEQARGSWLRYLVRTRERFLDNFGNEETRAFIKGVIFGDKTDIDEDTREDFNINATGHILAVSGLHIGFLYTLLRVLAGKRRTLPLTLAIIAVLIIYGDMTLWSASTVRAVLVLSISLMSVYVKRPSDLLTSVSAAAVVILASNPYELFNTGFQMSFMALLGISFLADPLSRIMGEGLGTMLAVQLGIAPLTAVVFHRLNFLSIFINIPIITISSLLVPLCIVTLFYSTAAGVLPGIFARLITSVSGLTLRLNNLLAADGAWSGYITVISAGMVILFYLGIFCLSSEWLRIRILRRERKPLIAAALCIVLVAGSVTAATFNTFADDEIVFVSVGQGDCTHIRAGGKDVLIDGGGSSMYNVGHNTLMPYLMGNGAERVEMALVTHLHMDHYRGIWELAEEYPVGAVGIPADYMESYDASDIQPENIRYLECGSRISITDDVYVEPIWPLSGHEQIDIDDENEHNMVYMVHYRGVRIMVTGDLLEEDELGMIEYYRHSKEGLDALKCDVLKVAHHGSKSSSSEEFLDAAAPEIAVISVGKNNLYGHPHPQTLERLQARGIEIYRTDENGAVGIDIKSYGKRYRLLVDTAHLTEL